MDQQKDGRQDKEKKRGEMKRKGARKTKPAFLCPAAGGASTAEM